MSTSKGKTLATPKGSLTRSGFGASNTSIASITSERSTAGGPYSLRKSPSCNEILNPDADLLKVGDKVYVNGIQPATIRYLNETSFAPGMWAGLELETDTGKNDGSVNGVRYFECRQKYGLFVRPHRLTLEPIASQKVKSPTEGMDISPTTEVSQSRTTTTEVQKVSVQKSSFINTNLNVGDRVQVSATSGLKDGVLRFLGETEFAPGVWCGVELEEPTGKNDGSVAGRRYFICEMNRGLFAPIHKVTKYHVKQNIRNVTMKSQTLTRRSLKRSGSQESLASITSATSMRSGRIKLGVTSLSNQNQSPTKKPTAAAASSTSFALHQTLREKEDHISQLLNERESERGEVARMSVRVEELERELSLIRNEHHRYIQEKTEEVQNLRQAVEESAKIQKELLSQLDEERKKVEVYEFRLEEEMVNSMEIKEEMEKLIDKQKCTSKDDEKEEEMFQLQEDLIKKEEKILQLESSLELKKQEIQALHSRAREREDHLLKAEHRQKRYLETIDELNLKISKKESDIRRAEEVEMQLKEQLNVLREEIENARNASQTTASLQESIRMQLKSKESELNILERKLSDMSEEIRALRDEKLATEREKNKFQSLLTEKDAEISTLSRKLADLNSDLQTIAEEKRIVEMELKTMKSMSEEGSKQISTLMADIRRQQSENSELSRQLDSIRRQLEAVRTDANQRIADKDAKINIYLKSEAELKGEITQKIQENEKLRQQLHEALTISGDNNAKWQRLNDELKEKQTEIASLWEELRMTKNQLANAENDAKRSTDELKELSALITKKNEEIEALKKDLREKEDELYRKNQEISSKQYEIQTLQHEVDTLKSRLSRQESDLKSLSDQLFTTKDQLGASNSEKAALAAELRDVKCTLFEKENEISKLMSSKFEMEGHIHDLAKQVHDLKETNTELVLDREKLLKTIRLQEHGLEEREETIKKLKDQLNIMREQFSDYRDSLEKELNKAKTDADNVLAELRTEIQILQEENEKLRSLICELENEIKSLKENITFTETRHKEVLEGFEQECQRLENRLEEMKNVVEEKNLQLEDREKVVMQMERESKLSLEMYKKKMESEKTSLIHKIERLESSLNANVVSFKEVRSGESKETYESQIEFLNSVIVDMQKKNDDLKARLQVLEEIGLTDFEENAQNKANGHVSRPPRLFCDVCDVFDLHDTEDCPEQVTHRREIVMHSHYQATRQVERPYCGNCEVFGHATDTCKDDQSF